ncbi:MAG: hypothetical protein RMJ07_05535 [Nitrososphaerota archaeon]|nr:OPT/YSL family transporter [Candidatus Bathyarchaeota archaeon]MDW8049124.1 hypothetical protein [Nitrososphaerota archaeon]
MMQADERIRSGISWISMLAGIFSIFVFIPANIYLELMTGQQIEVSIFAMLLFVEMGKLLGKRITRQEAFLISFLASLGTYAPLDMVYRVYFRNSDIVGSFGIADYIPEWYVPPPSANIQWTRTFLHPSWTTPFLLYFIQYLLGTILAISLGLLLKEFYIDIQKLPFPLQQVYAQQIETISEGEESSVNLLFGASVIGFMWGFIVYAIPNLTKAYMGRSIELVPIPWYDFSAQIENYFPGAMFGVATSLSPIISALVLSEKMVASMIIGSYAVWFFGNWLTVAYQLAPDTDPILLGYQSWWLPRMSAEDIYSRSTMYFWAVPLIGFSLAAGLMPIFRYPRKFVKAISSLGSLSAWGRRVKYYVILGIAAPIAAGLTIYMLLTDFPLYIAAPLFIFAPLTLSMVNSQMVGETGVNLDVDVPMNLIYYASGYKGVEVWFVPTLINIEGTGWLKNYKVAELTGTSIWSLIKTRLMFTPLLWFVGYMFVQLFWSLAPIPSGVYPGARIFWRVRAINRCIWIKGREIGLFNPYWLLYAFGVGAIAYFATEMFGFLSAIGLAAGTATTPHYASLLAIGLMIKMAIRRYKGKNWWSANHRLLAAGLGVGVSIAVTISVAISFIVSSIWLLPI